MVSELCQYWSFNLKDGVLKSIGNNELICPWALSWLTVVGSPLAAFLGALAPPPRLNLAPSLDLIQSSITIRRKYISSWSGHWRLIKDNSGNSCQLIRTFKIIYDIWMVFSYQKSLIIYWRHFLWQKIQWNMSLRYSFYVRLKLVLYLEHVQINEYTTFVPGYWMKERD